MANRLTVCLKCGCEDFTERVVPVESEWPKEVFSVSAPAMVCGACGWVTMTDDQADNFATASCVEYYRRHPVFCFKCNSQLEATDRPRVMWCGKCNDSRYIKPTRQECERLVEVVRTNL